MKNECLSHRAVIAMPAGHRPDSEAFRQGQSMDEGPKATPSDSCVFPYINQEDLSNSEHLLQFLDSRANAHPKSFALSELEFCPNGRTLSMKSDSRCRWPTALMSSGYCDQCAELTAYGSMGFGDCDYCTELTAYGQIHEWGSYDAAVERECKMKGCFPGDGVQILFIQSRIYRFLVETCELAMHDQPAETLATGNIPNFNQDNVTGAMRGEDIGESFTEAVTCALYSRHGNLNFKRMAQIVEHEYEASRDHLWALRSDPCHGTSRLLSRVFRNIKPLVYQFPKWSESWWLSLPARLPFHSAQGG